MSFTTLHKFITTSALSLILVGFSAGSFLWLWKEVENSEFVLREIESKIASFENERRQAKAADRILKERQEDTERIRKFFVDRERPIEFIESLERLAGNTKNNLALNVDETKAEIGEFVFRITVEGSASSVLAYLRLLELMPYGVYVNDVVFERISREFLPPVSATKRVKASIAPPTSRLIFSIQVNPFTS